MAKAKFRVGQVVRVYGIPEIDQADRLLGYRKISSVERRGVAQFYMIAGGLYRESRLRPLTKRERRA